MAGADTSPVPRWAVAAGRSIDLLPQKAAVVEYLKRRAATPDTCGCGRRASMILRALKETEDGVSAPE